MRDYDDNLLLGYVEGDLTEAERATVEKWIAGDPRLGALLRGMMADRQALRDLPQPEAPAWVLDDVDQGLERSMLLQTSVVDHEQGIVRQRHVARRMLTGLAMAAMVLLAAGVVIWSIMMTSNPPVSSQYEVAKGGAAHAPSPGGTEVVMDQPRARVMSKSGEPAAEEIASKDAPAATQMKPGGADVVAKDHADAVPNDVEAMTMKSALPEKNAGKGPVNPSAKIGRVVAEQPADQGIEAVEVVVQTDNFARTVAQLNDVARTIPHAQLIAETPNLAMSAGNNVDNQKVHGKIADAAITMKQDVVKQPQAGIAPSASTAASAAPAASRATNAPAVSHESTPATPATRSQTMVAQQPPPSPHARQAASPAAAPVTMNYQLVVPADQLQNTLVMLQAPSFNNFAQNVALRRQSQVAQRPLTQRNAAYWPSRSPDYAAILREQLPAPGSTAAPGSAAAPAPDRRAMPDVLAEQQSQTLQTQTQGQTQTQAQDTQQALQAPQAAQADAAGQPTITVPIVIEIQSVSPAQQDMPAAPATTPPAAPANDR